jgi:hypothetical protein
VRIGKPFGACVFQVNSEMGLIVSLISGQSGMTVKKTYQSSVPVFGSDIREFRR